MVCFDAVSWQGSVLLSNPGVLRGRERYDCWSFQVGQAVELLRPSYLLRLGRVSLIWQVSTVKTMG